MLDILVILKINDSNMNWITGARLSEPIHHIFQNIYNYIINLSYKVNIIGEICELSLLYYVYLIKEFLINRILYF